MTKEAYLYDKRGLFTFQVSAFLQRHSAAAVVCTLDATKEERLGRCLNKSGFLFCFFYGCYNGTHEPAIAFVRVRVLAANVCYNDLLWGAGVRDCKFPSFSLYKCIAHSPCMLSTLLPVAYNAGCIQCRLHTMPVAYTVIHGQEFVTASSRASFSLRSWLLCVKTRRPSRLW